MKHFTNLSLLTLVILLLVGCDSKSPETTTTHLESDSRSFVAPESGLATPEEAVDIFFTGIIEGDRDKSASATIVNDAVMAYIDANILQLQAFDKFATTEKESFGEGGIPVGVLADRIRNNIESVVIEMVDDTNAVWPQNPASPLQLTKSDDGWKVNLASRDLVNFLSAATRVSKDTAKMWDEARAMINNGQIETRESARKELGKLKQKYRL